MQAEGLDRALVHAERAARPRPRGSPSRSRRCSSRRRPSPFEPGWCETRIELMGPGRGRARVRSASSSPTRSKTCRRWSCAPQSTRSSSVSQATAFIRIGPEAGSVLESHSARSGERRARRRVRRRSRGRCRRRRSAATSLKQALPRGLSAGAGLGEALRRSAASQRRTVPSNVPARTRVPSGDQLKERSQSAGRASSVTCRLRSAASQTITFWS